MEEMGLDKMEPTNIMAMAGEQRVLWVAVGMWPIAGEVNPQDSPEVKPSPLSYTLTSFSSVYQVPAYPKALWQGNKRQWEAVGE